jgi:hypothetical protein
VLGALDTGASCLYFDHHYPGAIPDHPRLEAHIRYMPGICTSLIVDDFLGGRYRAWAVTGAFGDNLPEQAEAAARSLRLDGAQMATLRTLGECLNYNAYGDTVEDLHFPPAELYRRLTAFADPLEFAAQDPAFDTLQRGYQQDMALAAAADPLESSSTYHVTIFPDERWSRRVSGAWANRLATAHPHRAHAVLVRRSTHFSVSVRAPIARPTGADELCRRFGGSGRPGAAGIDQLPPGELRRFVTEFARAFPDSATSP